MKKILTVIELIDTQSQDEQVFLLKTYLTLDELKALVESGVEEACRLKQQSKTVDIDESKRPHIRVLIEAIDGTESVECFRQPTDIVNPIVRLCVDLSIDFASVPLKQSPKQQPND